MCKLKLHITNYYRLYRNFLLLIRYFYFKDIQSSYFKTTSLIQEIINNFVLLFSNYNYLGFLIMFYMYIENVLLIRKK